MISEAASKRFYGNLCQVYDVWSGQNRSVLRGHYDLVNCCTFHPQGQVLKVAVSDMFYVFLRYAS